MAPSITTPALTYFQSAVRCSRDKLRPLALHVVQLLAEELQRSVLFAQGAKASFEQSFDGFFDVGDGRGAATSGCMSAATFSTVTGRLFRI